MPETVPWPLVIPSPIFWRVAGIRFFAPLRRWTDFLGEAGDIRFRGLRSLDPFDGPFRWPKTVAMLREDRWTGARDSG